MKDRATRDGSCLQYSHGQPFPVRRTDKTANVRLDLGEAAIGTATYPNESAEQCHRQLAKPEYYPSQNCRRLKNLSGVEKSRSDVSLPVAMGQVFTWPPHSGLTWLCSSSRSSNRTGPFRASGSRKKVHDFTHGKLTVRRLRRTRTNWSCRSWSEYRFLPDPFHLCLARSHRRSLRQVCRSSAR